VELEFSGEIWFWRGPAPWHFVSVPVEQARAIADVAGSASYGWGCIPVSAQLGGTDWTTSLIPKDGGYLVPVKTQVRRAERLELGDTVHVRLCIDA
jgi:hypothetical protein